MTDIIKASQRVVALSRATIADTDEQLLQSWLASLNSTHSRRNFEQTARRFLQALPVGLRAATIEDVRSALDAITGALAASARRQYVLRVKSLLSYGHELGYLPFDAGIVIKVRSEGNHGAALAKRIVSETEVALLIRAARERRHRALPQVAYGGGARVSKLAGLTWGDVIQRGDCVQLNIIGKGSVSRNVLLPPEASKALLSLGRRGEADVVSLTGKNRLLSDAEREYVCSTCMGTSGIGRRIAGTKVMAAIRETARRGRPATALFVFCAAVLGATIHGTSVRPTAMETGPTTASTSSASVLPENFHLLEHAYFRSSTSVDRH